jgi:putative ABC transport system substrate-binding protein
MNRRRLLLAAPAWLALARAGAAVAQQKGRVWRVGAVWAGSRSGQNASELAFLAGMKEHGYEVGRNLALESRYAEGEPGRYAPLVEELVALAPDILLGTSTGVAIEMKRRTTTIPIVTGTTSDPVGSGLAQSLARPGGNVTGMAVQIHELGAKHIELVAEALPRVRRVAVLTHLAGEKHLWERYEQLAQSAAAAKGVTLEAVRVKSRDEVQQSVRAMEKREAGALLITPSPPINALRREVIEAAAAIRLASIGFEDSWAADGGLMSYGPNFLAAYRRTAYFVDRIFKGATPAELPVEQPTVFSFIVNARVAKAFGVKLPAPILLRADRVIE